MPAYHNLWHRLTSNIHEPDNDSSCWYWARKLDREAYGQINVWVAGLGRTATLKAHIVAWLCITFEFDSTNDLYLVYLEHSASGMELDHKCECRGCIRPDHLEHVCNSINVARRDARRKRARNGN